MVQRADQGGGRPPSVPGLSRRSGRIPALPYPPIKHFKIVRQLSIPVKKKVSIPEEKSGKSQAFLAATVVALRVGVPSHKRLLKEMPVSLSFGFCESLSDHGPIGKGLRQILCGKN